MICNNCKKEFEVDKNKIRKEEGLYFRDLILPLNAPWGTGYDFYVDCSFCKNTNELMGNNFRNVKFI